MKKTILSLVLIFSSIVLFAQSEQENTNKWIDSYTNWNNSKDWSSMISNFDACIKEIPNWS